MATDTQVEPQIRKRDFIEILSQEEKYKKNFNEITATPAAQSNIPSAATTVV